MHAIYHHKRGFWQCGAGWRFGRRHATVYPDRTEALHVCAMRGLSNVKLLEVDDGFYAEVKEQAAIDVRNEALRRGEG